MDNSSTGGIGLFGVLGVAFIILKLTGVVGWSWWWVTAPLWGPFALVLVLALVIAVVSILIDGIKQNTEPPRPTGRRTNVAPISAAF